MTEWLAWVPAGEDIDWRDCGPVHLGDIPEVRYPGVVRFKDAAGSGIYLRHPLQLPPSERCDCHIEAAVNSLRTANQSANTQTL
jgi:hypothetical protein